MKGRHIILFAGAAAGLLLAAGILNLFFMRFRTGDIYPAYSSLRGDPLGTKVLYESLSKCGLTSVSRNYAPVDKIDPDADTTILFLGDTTRDYGRNKILDPELVGAVNSQLRKGVRIVITLLPRNVEEKNVTRKKEPDAEDKEKDKKPEKDEKETKKPTDTENEKKLKEKIKLISFYDWMGTDVGDSPYFGLSNATLDPAFTGTKLPPSISCHTSLCFTNSDSNWKVVYRRGNKPVVIERAFGKGSIVMSAVSYFASNEAMLHERHPAILSWLIGAHSRIIFDESHLGLSENPGVAGLMLKYRLYWLVAGLLVFALLFIWQNSVSLVPFNSRKETLPVIETAKGKDSATGLVNLLRRSISHSLIVKTCVDEWKKSTSTPGREMEAKIARIEGLARLEATNLPGRHRLAETYNEICRVLKTDVGASIATPAGADTCQPTGLGAGWNGAHTKQTTRRRTDEH